MNLVVLKILNDFLYTTEVFIFGWNGRNRKWFVFRHRFERTKLQTNCENHIYCAIKHFNKLKFTHTAHKYYLLIDLVTKIFIWKCCCLLFRPLAWLVDVLTYLNKKKTILIKHNECNKVALNLIDWIHLCT